MKFIEREVVGSETMGLVRFAHVIMDVVFGNIVLLMLNVFINIRFSHSHSAEYRTEARTARLVGRSVSLSSLELFFRGSHGRKAMFDLFPFAKDQNGRIFDHMGSAAREADPEEIHALIKRELDAAEAEPTVQVPLGNKITFLNSLADVPGKSDVDRLGDMAAIESELAPLKDKHGEALMKRLNAESFNK